MSERSTHSESPKSVERFKLVFFGVLGLTLTSMLLSLVLSLPFWHPPADATGADQVFKAVEEVRAVAIYVWRLGSVTIIGLAGVGAVRTL